MSDSFFGIWFNFREKFQTHLWLCQLKHKMLIWHLFLIITYAFSVASYSWNKNLSIIVWRSRISRTKWAVAWFWTSLTIFPAASFLCKLLCQTWKVLCNICNFQIKSVLKFIELSNVKDIKVSWTFQKSKNENNSTLNWYL